MWKSIAGLKLGDGSEKTRNELQKLGDGLQKPRDGSKKIRDGVQMKRDAAGMVGDAASLVRDGANQFDVSRFLLAYARFLLGNVAQKFSDGADLTAISASPQPMPSACV